MLLEATRRRCNKRCAWLVERGALRQNCDPRFSCHIFTVEVRGPGLENLSCTAPQGKRRRPCRAAAVRYRASSSAGLATPHTHRTVWHLRSRSLGQWPFRGLARIWPAGLQSFQNDCTRPTQRRGVHCVTVMRSSGRPTRAANGDASVNRTASCSKASDACS